MLLCLFHDLQTMWRWLWDGKHGIAKDHRPTLMKMVKSMVYSESEQMLKEEYLKISISAFWNTCPSFTNVVVNGVWHTGVI